MADMTKCNSAECPQKEKCLRWTIPSNPYQYYLDFYAVRAKKDCEYFLEKGRGND